MKKFFFKYWLLTLFIACATGYLLGVLRVGSTVWGDSIYYYAYTHSLVMDGDISFANESVEPSLPFPNPPKVNPATGLVISNFSPGTGLLWIPAFVLGQLVTGNSYSLITQAIVGLSAVGFGTLGVYFFALGLRLIFPQRAVVQTVISFLLASQLFYYLSLDPLNSHSVSFLFASLSFYTWVQIWQAKAMIWKQAIALGVSLGTLALIRNQDVLTGVVLLGSLLFHIQPKVKILQHLFLAVLVAVTIGSIQLLTNWTLYHSWQSPYIINGQSLSWFSPDFIRVLFSQGNGFFRYAPLAMISFLGLLSFAKVQKKLAITCALVFLCQLYVIASWDPEIVGGPYGSRMFVGTLPFLGVGLAHLLTRSTQQWWLVCTAVLFMWNLFQIWEMLARW